MWILPMILANGLPPFPDALRESASVQSRCSYFWSRWVNAYADRLASAGLPERRANLHPALRMYATQPQPVGAAA